jgi:aquaporin Z
MRMYAVEFIGTFFLVFTVINAVAQAGDLAPIAIGSVLMVMVYAGGHISGGHFNPAVSFAAWIRSRLEWNDMLTYWASPLVAALVAGLIGLWMFDFNVTATFSGKLLAEAFLVELLFTFALAWVVLNVATSKDHPNNSFYGLAIGFTVVAGALAVGGLSGGAFNPAVAFGNSIGGVFAWGNIWLFVLADLLGGAAAGYAFKALNADDA